jgi:hypothetical protein
MAFLINPNLAHLLVVVAVMSLLLTNVNPKSTAPEQHRFTARFPKTILGQVLRERTELSCEVRGDGEDGMVVVDAFPLDAVERKLMFGARKGVTQTVVTWFIAYLENNLELPPAQ